MSKHRKDLPHSSSIQCCEYDEETKEMHITFASGGKHRFKDVPKEHYDGICGHSSPGAYFHQYIRRKFESNSADLS